MSCLIAIFAEILTNALDQIIVEQYRTRQLTPEVEAQIRVAACLRHPLALNLYPEDVGGPGGGERPTLTAEGMVVHCAGAAQLGDDIQSRIGHLPFDQMANILLTIVTKVIDDIEKEFAGSHEQPGGYVFIPQVQDLLQQAWEIINTHFSDEEEAYSTDGRT